MAERQYILFRFSQARDPDLIVKAARDWLSANPGARQIPERHWEILLRVCQPAANYGDLLARLRNHLTETRKGGRRLWEERGLAQPLFDGLGEAACVDFSGLPPVLQDGLAGLAEGERRPAIDAWKLELAQRFLRSLVLQMKIDRAPREGVVP
jgi:hypothetical protein